MNILTKDTEISFFDELDAEDIENERQAKNINEEYFKVVGYAKPIEDSNGEEYAYEIDEQERILMEMIETIFYSSKTSTFVTVDSDYNLMYLKEPEMLFFLQEQKYVGCKIKIEIFDEKLGKFKLETVELVRITKALKYIRNVNQIENIDYKMDLFLPESKIVKRDKFLELTKNGINLRRPKSIKKEEREEALECIEDYKDHNPYNEMLIKLVVAAMFTTNRKMAYFYFIVPSDWGKSFWMSTFQSLNIATEVKYSELEMSPGPIMPEEIFGKIFTYEDEFKNFGAKNKEFTHSANIVAKGKMRSQVPIYGKVMFSAETSNSVKDFVDDQIINRITLFNLNAKGKLVDREVIKKHGSDFYNLALQNYNYILLKQEIAKYRKLGFKESSIQAAKLLNAIYSKFKIDKSESLMDNLGAYIRERLQEIVAQRGQKKFEKYSDYIFLDSRINDDGTKTNTLFLNRVKDLFLLLIEESPNRSFKGTSQYKKDKIEDILGHDIRSNYHPLYRASRKGIKMPYEDLFTAPEDRA